MFGKKDTYNSGERVDTVIGKETKFTGSLQTNGTVRIDGYFEGDIVITGDIMIGEGGTVKANIKARNCTVSGEVYGDIIAEQKIEIVSSGKVYGNITAANLLIGEGAIFCGTCDMKKNFDTDAVAMCKEITSVS